jgi:hypothetical protein
VPAPRPLLSRDAFARLVLCERRRSERSGRPFAVLALEARASLDPEAPLGRTIRDGVVAATRETDVAGWIAPSILGVLLPDLSESDSRVAIEPVRLRISQALGNNEATRDAVTVENRVFPEEAPVAEAPARSSAGRAASVLESLLYPELGEARGPRRRAQVVKRALDVLGSASLLAALVPLWLLIAGVRRTSPGPASSPS